MSQSKGLSASPGQFATLQVFTTGQAALACGVSQQTIIRMFDSGKLNGFRVPSSRFRRVPRDELLRMMEEQGIPTKALHPATRVVAIVCDAGTFPTLSGALDGEQFATVSTPSLYEACIVAARSPVGIIVVVGRSPPEELSAAVATHMPGWRLLECPDGNAHSLRASVEALAPE